MNSLEVHSINRIVDGLRYKIHSLHNKHVYKMYNYIGKKCCNAFDGL